MHVLTREQAREIDRRAVNSLRIPGIVLMENAARGVAEIAADRCAGRGPVAIFCGPGNNGGDGFAIARHLANRNIAVRIHLPGGDAGYRGDAGQNLEIVRAMGLPLVAGRARDGATLAVDALFGTGLSRPLEPPYLAVVRELNGWAIPVVAVDIPSGLDADDGRILGAAVRATVTATMIAPKAGFARGEGPNHVGEVVPVDIGVPPGLVETVLAGS